MIVLRQKIFRQPILIQQGRKKILPKIKLPHGQNIKFPYKPVPKDNRTFYQIAKDSTEAINRKSEKFMKEIEEKIADQKKFVQEYEEFLRQYHKK